MKNSKLHLDWISSPTASLLVLFLSKWNYPPFYHIPYLLLPSSTFYSHLHPDSTSFQTIHLLPFCRDMDNIILFFSSLYISIHFSLTIIWCQYIVHCIPFLCIETLTSLLNNWPFWFLPILKELHVSLAQV